MFRVTSRRKFKYNRDINEFFSFFWIKQIFEFDWMQFIYLISGQYMTALRSKNSFLLIKISIYNVIKTNNPVTQWVKHESQS